MSRALLFSPSPYNGINNKDNNSTTTIPGSIRYKVHSTRHVCVSARGNGLLHARVWMDLETWGRIMTLDVTLTQTWRHVLCQCIVRERATKHKHEVLFFVFCFFQHTSLMREVNKTKN